jgi:hypothetical protein
LVGLALVAVAGSAPFMAGASSHREAPRISQDPMADNADIYAFIHQQRPDAVSIIATYIPLQHPSGGPNYFQFGDDVLYEIHVDTNGDAQKDISYQFTFETTKQDPLTFLYNTGPVTSPDDPDLNVRQKYSVTEVLAAGTLSFTLAANLPVPPANIGSKSTPNYDDTADQAVCTIRLPAPDATTPTGQDCDTRGETPGPSDIKLFAGVRDDPFFVDLQIFDLLTLRGQPPPVGYSQGNNVPIDSVKGYNVHTLALQVPIARLTGPNSVTGPNSEPVIGVWATASRRSMRVLGPGGNPINTGSWVQVSRLGIPLVNEVVIPLALKDTFNNLDPSQDLSVFSGSTAFQRSILDPELARRLCSLYGVPLPRDTGSDCDTDLTFGNPATGRSDIFDIFLAGIVTAKPYVILTPAGTQSLPTGTNINRPQTFQPAELLRLNTAPAFRPGISGSLCAPTPHRLGFLAGDVCGFPNGRRLADDVVDAELLVVGGGLFQLTTGDTSFAFDLNLVNVLTDRINENDRPFASTFPYLATPHSGQDYRIFSLGVPLVQRQ